MTQPNDPNQPYQQQPQPGTPPPPPPAQGQYVPPSPPPPPQPAYGAPAPAYGAPAPGYAPALPESPSAKNAMIWGIVGLVAWAFTCGIGGLLGIGGIVLGGKAKKEIAASGGRLGGESNANLGVILGWVSTVLGGLAMLVWVLYLLFFAAVFSSIPTAT